jgi:aryl-alcohol dehydrogenase-like predicted oxidoreductase
MQQRELGSTGLVVSALGLGCMGLSQGYGPADDNESIHVIGRALDLGVTMLDTAMSYGAGHNEELIASALSGRRGDQVTLATKFGIVRDELGVRLDGRPENVGGYCDASLTRLGVDVIDLYYLHRVDPAVPVAETVGAMSELVSAGKVRHLGLSEVTVEQLRRAAAVHPIAAVQFEWSLLWREAEDDLVPAARRLGVGLVPYSPLGRGLLTATLTPGDIDASEFRRADARFHGDHLTTNAALVRTLRDAASELRVTSAQLALAWLLGQGPDVVPIPGTRHVDRLIENTGAVNLALDPAQLQRLDDMLPRSSWAGDRQSFAVPATVRTPG